jgi:hypothetical protein
MFGRGGRYICRRSPRAGHSNRWCITISLLLLHIRHVEAILGFILFRCAFRGMCCVLNRKIMTCSCLCNRSKGSFKFGVVMCAKTALPVVSIAQLFSHSSFLLFLNICFAVCIFTGRFGCCLAAPAFARVSALSFPCMLVCPGIHCNVSLIVWALIIELAASAKDWHIVFPAL